MAHDLSSDLTFFSTGTIKPAHKALITQNMFKRIQFKFGDFISKAGSRTLKVNH